MPVIKGTTKELLKPAIYTINLCEREKLALKRNILG